MGRVNLAESLQTAFPLKMVNNHAKIPPAAIVCSHVSLDLSDLLGLLRCSGNNAP